MTVTFEQLRKKLRSYDRLVPVTGEELLAYFRHWQTCLYSGDPIRVEGDASHFVVHVGQDEFEVRVSGETDFYEVQMRWDRFLRKRLRWDH